jgi:hypothetical protein
MAAGKGSEEMNLEALKSIPRTGSPVKRNMPAATRTSTATREGKTVRRECIDILSTSSRIKRSDTMIRGDIGVCPQAPIW